MLVASMSGAIVFGIGAVIAVAAIAGWAFLRRRPVKGRRY
jgi:hypothetical protein